MYDDFAHLWPLISDPAGYEKEANLWRRALGEKLGPGRHEILELGVGGGNNLSHLTKDFQATAVDLSEKMLDNSRRLNPEVEHHVGDMRSVRLGRKFKAVLVHDAVDYLLTEEDLLQTFITAVVHLEPRGVLVIAPDQYRETFSQPQVSYSTRSKGDLELTHIEYSYDPDPEDTTTETLNFYLLREHGHLRVDQDLHILGLFPLQTWIQRMEEAGFQVEIAPYDVHDDHREAYLLIGQLK